MRVAISSAEGFKKGRPMERPCIIALRRALATTGTSIGADRLPPRARGCGLV